jgi:hypothetical protein
MAETFESNKDYIIKINKKTGNYDIAETNCYLDVNPENLVSITQVDTTNWKLSVGDITKTYNLNLYLYSKDLQGSEDKLIIDSIFEGVYEEVRVWYGDTTYAMWGQYTDNIISAGTIESINLQTLGNSTQIYDDINKNLQMEGANSDGSKIYIKNNININGVDTLNPTQMQVFNGVNNTVSVVDFTQNVEQSNRYYGCASTGTYGFWTGYISTSNANIRSVRFNLSNLNDSVLWGDTDLGYTTSNYLKLQGHCSNGSLGMISEIEFTNRVSAYGKIYSYNLTTPSQCVYWNTLNYNNICRTPYCSSDSNTNKGFFHRKPISNDWYYVDMVTTGHLVSYGSLSKKRYNAISTTNGNDKGIVMGGYAGSNIDYSNISTTTNYEIFGISSFDSASGSGDLIKNHYWGVGSSGN